MSWQVVAFVLGLAWAFAFARVGVRCARAYAIGRAFAAGQTNVNVKGV